MTNSLVLAVMALLIQAVPQQQNFGDVPDDVKRQEQTSSLPTMGQVGRDPFWNDWQDFQKKEADWRRLDEDLETRLASMSVCDAGCIDTIQEVRNAAFASFDSQIQYYKKWRNLARSDRDLFNKLLADRSSLRDEIESSLQDAKSQSAELQKRKQMLQQSLEQAGNKVDEKELRSLDALIKSTEDRIANYENAIRKWHDAERYNNDAITLSDRLAANVADLQVLLHSETANWRMYYEARDARARLRCVTERQPQRWSRPKPPEEPSEIR